MMSASIRPISDDKVFMARPHQPTSVLSEIQRKVIVEFRDQDMRQQIVERYPETG
jgi:hypothetical protein